MKIVLLSLFLFVYYSQAGRVTEEDIQSLSDAYKKLLKAIFDPSREKREQALDTFSKHLQKVFHDGGYMEASDYAQFVKLLQLEEIGGEAIEFDKIDNNKNGRIELNEIMKKFEGLP